MIASTLAAQTAQTANRSSVPTDLSAFHVACFKLENATKFERKIKTPFRTWWDLV